MKKLQILTILLLSVFIFSCKEKSNKTSSTVKIETLEPAVDLNELKGDFMKWWTYYSYNTSLSLEFTGLNEQSDTIDKKQFLEKLMTGNYIPLKIKSDDNALIYKLYKLDAEADESIGSTIKNESMRIYGLTEMEGTPLPPFNFSDLEGNVYTSENTKGKTIILKTWFITCTACVAEFPELNEFVEKYKQRDDVIFLSLALDPKSELEEFLRQNEFEYKVVPGQKEYIFEKLRSNAFPTHLVVDKDGTILKVANKASEMIAFFENIKQSTDKKMAPPPPPPPPSSVAPPPPPPPPAM